MSDKEFTEIGNAAAWIEANRLDDTLAQFADRPYARIFTRERGPADPDIHFDYSGFKRDLHNAFRIGLATATEAYLATWRLAFHHVTVMGTRQDIDIEHPTIFVNHFHNTAAHDYRFLARGPEDIDFFLLQAVRDPYENLASVKQMWTRVANYEPFVEIAYARWEIYLLSALRNRALYPDRCDLVLYDSDAARMTARLRASRVAPLRMLGAESQPTVMGLPFAGHSFKQRAGGAVERPYDYEKIFTAAEHGFITRRYDKLLSDLGVTSLEELAVDTPRSSLFSQLCDMGSDALEYHLRAIETSILGFANIHNVYYDFVAGHFRARSPLRRVLDAWRIWRRV